MAKLTLLALTATRLELAATQEASIRIGSCILRSDAASPTTLTSNCTLAGLAAASLPPPPPAAPTPSTCLEHLYDAAGAAENGMYDVMLPGEASTTSVYCDMTNGGWMLVASGLSGYNAEWAAAGGFGDPANNDNFKLSDAAINRAKKWGLKVTLNKYDSTNKGPLFFNPACFIDHTKPVPAGSACLQASHAEGGPWDIFGQAASHRRGVNTDVCSGSGCSGVAGYWVAHNSDTGLATPNYIGRTSGTRQRMWVR